MRTIDFFSELFAGCTGHIEIRLLDERTGHVAQRWFPLPTGIAAAAEFTAARSGHAHVFFGVCPRSRSQGRDAAVQLVQCLFADVDAKDFAGGEREVQQRFVELADAGFPPSILVRSGGGGRHAYWLFERPLKLPAGDEHLRNEVRETLWAIGSALGIPPKANVVHDLARVLRVPGTVNIKAKYPQPLPCEVEWTNPRRYSLQDFADLRVRHARPADRLPPRQWVAFKASPDAQLPDPETLLADLPLSAAVKGLIRFGSEQGHRSEADQKAIVALLRAGAGPDRIHAIFSHPDLAIGEKFRCHGYPDRYLGYSISKAQQWIAAHPERYPAVDRQLPIPDTAAFEQALERAERIRPGVSRMLRSSSEGHRIAALVELARGGAGPGALLAAAQVASHSDPGAAERLYRYSLELARRPRSMPTPHRAAGGQER